MHDPTTWSCYGRLWDEDAIECTGGFDLAYKHPATNSNLRERCAAFDLCRQKKKSVSNVLPPSTLVRHPQPPPATPYATRPAQVPQYTQAPAGTVPQLHYTAPPQYLAQHPPQMAVTQQLHQPNNPYYAQFGPQYVPTSYQIPGAQVPSYLAIPEPVDGTSLWVRLLRELGRAVAKAVGITLANYADHHPIRPYPAPGPQQQSTPQLPPAQR